VDPVIAWAASNNGHQAMPFANLTSVRREWSRGVISIVACSGVRKKSSWGAFIQWHMVVICIWGALFVTSQFDVIFMFPNQGFGEVCWHNKHIFLRTRHLCYVSLHWNTNFATLSASADFRWCGARGPGVVGGLMRGSEKESLSKGWPMKSLVFSTDHLMFMT